MGNLIRKLRGNDNKGSDPQEARLEQLDDLRRSNHAEERREAVLKLGALLVQQRSFDAAERVYREALAQDSSAWSYVPGPLGLLLEDQERYEEALALYHEAITAGNEWAHYALGHLLLYLGHNEEAASHLRRCLEANTVPRVRTVQRLLGRAISHTEPVAAEAIFRAVIEGARDEDAAWAASDLASLLARQDRNEEAEAADRLALELGVADPVPTMTGLGVLLLGRGEIDEAAALLERVLQDGDPRCLSEAARALGRCAWHTGDLRAAERHLRTATSVGEPDERDGALNDLGELLFSQDRLAEAREVFCAVGSSSVEERFRADAGLGDLLCRLGRFEEAEDAYRRALGGPVERRAAVGVALAHLLIDQARLEQAEDVLLDVLPLAESADDRSNALGLLTALAIVRNDVENAERLAHQTIAAGIPHNAAAAWAGLASLYELLKRPDDAEVARQEAEREEPGIVAEFRAREERGEGWPSDLPPRDW